MKTVLCILLCGTLSLSSFSQEPARGYIGLSAGPSFPIGEFESSNLDNDAAGLAKTGYHADLNFAYKLGKNFGIAGMLRTTSNPFNKDAFSNLFNLIAFGGSYTIHADNWKTGSVLLGGYGSFPINKSKTTFDSKLLVGFSSARFPALSQTFSYFGASSSSSSQSKTDLSLQYLLAAGFRFYATDKIGFLVDMDLSGANFEFSNIKSTDASGQESAYTKSQNITLIALSAGIAVMLK